MLWFCSLSRWRERVWKRVVSVPNALERQVQLATLAPSPACGGIERRERRKVLLRLEARQPHFCRRANERNITPARNRSQQLRVAGHAHGGEADSRAGVGK